MTDPRPQVLLALCAVGFTAGAALMFGVLTAAEQLARAYRSLERRTR